MLSMYRALSVANYIRDNTSLNPAHIKSSGRGDYDPVADNSTPELSLIHISPDPRSRESISDVLPLGVKAVDGLITVGKGQRIGIFAGSGVGKSTLLGMFARNTKADINVIALIGERGREVRAVSYTHLDVYKRQGQFLGLYLRKLFCRKSIICQ